MELSKRSADIFYSHRLNVNMIYFGNHGGEVFALNTSEVLHWYYLRQYKCRCTVVVQQWCALRGTAGGRLHGIL